MLLKDSFRRRQWKEAPVPPKKFSSTISMLKLYPSLTESIMLHAEIKYDVFLPISCFCPFQPLSLFCHHLCHQMSHPSLSTHAKYYKHHTLVKESLIKERQYSEKRIKSKFAWIFRSLDHMHGLELIDFTKPVNW